MEDRKVTAQVEMMASQVETVRTWVLRAGEFPTIAYNYALEIAKLLLKDEATPEDGAELARLVKGLEQDALRADMVRNALAQVLKGVTISDPDGRGTLQ